MSERATMLSPMSAPAENEPCVKLTFDGAVAVIALNRPAAYNAIDAAMAQALAAAMVAIERSESTRVIVLCGEGKGFCAGGDLHYFGSRGNGLRGAVDAVLNEGHKFLLALRATGKLVLTSVHGAAAGAGLSLAVAGDFCIAADNASFTPGYRKLGVSPDMGGTANMVRAIGLRRAMNVYLLQNKLTAADAERIGIVSRIVSAATLREDTLALAHELAAIPASAAQGTKALLQQSAGASLAAQLDAELSSFQECIHTPEATAAIARFSQANA